jgi:hypothetical protein
MRRGAGLLACLVALIGLFAGLGSGTAVAAGHKNLVEGTVYDTTCLATSCGTGCPPPPTCGPITARSSGAAVCAQDQGQVVACPLGSEVKETSEPICLPEEGCYVYPVYSGEGATVNVRRRGSTKVIANVPVVEGHFSIRLGPGEYVFHPYLAEESCWSGEVGRTKLPRGWNGPWPVDVDVHDNCVAHPDSQ